MIIVLDFYDFWAKKVLIFFLSFKLQIVNRKPSVKTITKKTIILIETLSFRLKVSSSYPNVVDFVTLTLNH